MNPPRKPHYELKQTYSDGTESEPEIVPVTKLPWSARMDRRGVLGVGFGTGVALALMLGKDGRGNGGGQQAVAEEASDENARAQRESISKVVITPDETTSISGSVDDTIKLWQLPEGSLLETLEAGQNGVLSLAIAPNGQTLASGGRDGTIKVWNLPQATLSQTWQAHEDNVVLALEIAPDNQTLVSAGSDGNIKLWNLPEGTLLQSWEVSSKPINDLAISPNGQILASGDGEGYVKLWNFTERELLQTLIVSPSQQPFLLKPISAVSISRDSQVLAAGDSGGTLAIFENLLEEAQLRIPMASRKIAFKELQSSGKEIKALDMGPDDKNLYSAQGGIVKVWEWLSGQVTETLEFFGDRDVVTTISISVSGQFLLVGSGSGRLKAWDLLNKVYIIFVDSALVSQPEPAPTPRPKPTPTPTTDTICTCEAVEICTCEAVEVCACEGICTCVPVYY